MGFFRRYQQGFEHAFERFRGRLSAGAEHGSAAFAGCFPLVSWLLRAFRGPRVSCSGAIFSRAWTPGRSGCTCERGPGYESRRARSWRTRSIRRFAKPFRRKICVTVLDNIGLPYSSINLTYSNSGTIGTADGEILVQLKPERGRPTGDYIDELRHRLPHEFPGRAIFLSARGYRDADSEFRDAGTDRYPNYGTGSGRELQGRR